MIEVSGNLVWFALFVVVCSQVFMFWLGYWVAEARGSQTFVVVLLVVGAIFVLAALAASVLAPPPIVGIVLAAGVICIVGSGVAWHRSHHAADLALHSPPPAQQTALAVVLPGGTSISYQGPAQLAVGTPNDVEHAVIDLLRRAHTTADLLSGHTLNL